MRSRQSITNNMEDLFYDSVDWLRVIESKEESLKTMAEELSRRNEQIITVIERKKAIEKDKEEKVRMIENEIKKRDEELVKKDVEIAQIKEEMKKKLERNQQTLKRKEEIIIQKEKELVKRNRIINEIDRKTKQHERLVEDYKDP